MVGAMPTTGQHSWYAVHTRSRHEKVVERRLGGQGVTTFLPLVKETHRWWDREKTVELPLFSSYVFVRMVMTPEERVRVFRVDGVLGFVGVRGQGTSIPDEQIEAVQRLVSESVPWNNYPFLRIGQPVRIRGGALDGLEGFFVAQNGENKLIISVNAIQRSLAISLHGYQVEPL